MICGLFDATLNTAEPIGSEVQKQDSRLVYADSLRGGASLMVAVFSHYHNFSARFQPGGVAETSGPFFDNIVFRNLHYNAFLSVDFFFILSGLIFSRIYADSIRDGSVGGW